MNPCVSYPIDEDDPRHGYGQKRQHRGEGALDERMKDIT
jgi:hypothetical protein